MRRCHFEKKKWKWNYFLLVSSVTLRELLPRENPKNAFFHDFFTRAWYGKLRIIRLHYKKLRNYFAIGIIRVLQLSGWNLRFKELCANLHILKINIFSNVLQEHDMENSRCHDYNLQFSDFWKELREIGHGSCSVNSRVLALIYFSIFSAMFYNYPVVQSDVKHSLNKSIKTIFRLSERNPHFSISAGILKCGIFPNVLQEHDMENSE